MPIVDACTHLGFDEHLYFALSWLDAIIIPHLQMRQQQLRSLSSCPYSKFRYVNSRLNSTHTIAFGRSKIANVIFSQRLLRLPLSCTSWRTPCDSVRYSQPVSRLFWSARQRTDPASELVVFTVNLQKGHVEVKYRLPEKQKEVRQFMNTGKQPGHSVHGFD
eukprot:2816003-Pyramimonas_sp.AAC.2